MKSNSDEGYKMKISKFWKNQSGVAAVEMAIIAPLLILLALGSFEFGLLVYNKQVITNACREGARAGIVRPGPDFSTDLELKDIVKNYCNMRLIDFGGNNTLTDGDIILNPSGSRSSANFGDEFSVKITYDHKLAVPSLFLPPSITTITLRSLALMKMEQEIP
jgi:Flp pilus assembly protein TadG